MVEGSILVRGTIILSFSGRGAKEILLKFILWNSCTVTNLGYFMPAAQNPP